MAQASKRSKEGDYFSLPLLQMRFAFFVKPKDPYDYLLSSQVPNLSEPETLRFQSQIIPKMDYRSQQQIRLK